MSTIPFPREQWLWSDLAFPALGCGDDRRRLVALARQRRVREAPWYGAFSAVITRVLLLAMRCY